MNFRPECKSESDKDPFSLFLAHQKPSSMGSHCSQISQGHEGFIKKTPNSTSTAIPRSFSLDKDRCNFQDGDLLCNDKYKLQEELGKGVFSHVFKAVERATNETVVIKIYKSYCGGTNYAAHAKEEVGILTHLATVDHNANMFVRLLDHFVEGSNSCLVLEPLAKTLCQLAADHGYYGFSLSIVKHFAWQMLVGLAELCMYNVGVIHADLKPDNIMIKERLHKKIKFIDFGSAFYSVARKAKYVQSRFYRSPEVILGYPCTSAVDMWSVGCILYELHSGKSLFNGKNEHDQLIKFTRVRGPLPYKLVKQGPKGEDFYEFKGENEYKLRDNSDAGQLQTLKALLNIENGGPEEKWKETKFHSKEHYQLFVDLLERMLEYDPTKRIKPLEALEHPFFREFLDFITFPTVSLISPPEVSTEPNPMMIDTPQLTLSAPLEDPQDVELLPDVSHLCSQIANKRTLMCSSTKETCKMTMIRKILSMPSDPHEHLKQRHDSTKSASKEDQKTGSGSREPETSEKMVEETKVPLVGAKKDAPPWPLHGISWKMHNNPIVNLQTFEDPSQLLVRVQKRCNPVPTHKAEPFLPHNQPFSASFKNLLAQGIPKQRTAQGTAEPFAEAMQDIMTVKKKRRYTRGAALSGERNKYGFKERVGGQSVGDTNINKK